MPPFPLLFRANERKIIGRENSLRLLCVGFRGASAATTNPIESQFCHCECKQCDTGGNANAEFVTCNVQKACPFKWIFAIFDQRSTLSIMSEFQTCMRECAHPYKIVRIHWLYMEILCSLANTHLLEPNRRIWKMIYFLRVRALFMAAFSIGMSYRCAVDVIVVLF